MSGVCAVFCRRVDFRHAGCLPVLKSSSRFRVSQCWADVGGFRVQRPKACVTCTVHPWLLTGRQSLDLPQLAVTVLPAYLGCTNFRNAQAPKTRPPKTMNERQTIRTTDARKPWAPGHCSLCELRPCQDTTTTNSS